MTVAILATGGTIANRVDGRIGIDELVARIRATASAAELAAIGDLVTEEPFRRGADEIGPEDWIRLAERATALLRRPDVEGLVVTHGTYTAEETAFFLHLVLERQKPVVIACSQRKHGTIGNDGDRNLVDAVRVAREPAIAACGVVLVEAGAIHAARDVIKTSQHPGGFRSPHGAIGSIEDDRVSLRHRPADLGQTWTPLPPPSAPAAWPRVDIVAAYVGADGAAIRGCLAAGARALIVDGFSYRGLPAPLQRAALAEAASDGVLVVRANRGRVGRIPLEPDAPFLSAGDLPAHKARILVALALSAGRSPAEIQALLDGG